MKKNEDETDNRQALYTSVVYRASVPKYGIRKMWPKQGDALLNTRCDVWIWQIMEKNCSTAPVYHDEATY
jgi:hypothetical protein